ncbi:MAG: hypothetical protein HY781_00075 [Chloroflexi bacterium]|nr:hypothetical protein [Chloroflexota bacterium]
MTNPTLDLIHRHASVRRYKPDPLPASIIEHSARRAARTARTDLRAVLVEQGFPLK